MLDGVVAFFVFAVVVRPRRSVVVGAAIVAVVGVGELVAAGLGASIVFLLTLFNVVFN